MSDVSSTNRLNPEFAIDEVHPSTWRRLESWIERVGERLNPILIKESRQALKSNQFLITFTLLLACAWGWSVLGVALLSPGVRYAPGGSFMLTGYFIVLAVPMLLIVPFSAFRSIAAERDDGTFELLSITSLSAWQIVTGKLGSAVVQMLVYYSALAPCIAFTYLLRGIDVVTICFVLCLTLFASLFLSAFGLAWGTMTKVRHWQVILSVLLLIALVAATVFWTAGFVALISEGITQAYDEADFWLAQAALVSMAGSFVALFVLAAAAQISFEADNRSTKLRVCMLVQQALWTGWIVLAWLRSSQDAFLYLGATFAALYWTCIGALLAGEREHVSERVSRRLPQSFLARTMFTWLNPGPVTGYFFVVSNMVALVLTLTIAAAIGSFVPQHFATYIPLLVAYVVLYLGICRLLIAMIRKKTDVGMLLAFLIHVLVVLLGAALPVLVVARLRGFSRLEYDMAQASNWAWTLAQAADGDIRLYEPVIATVLFSAFLVLMVNLLLNPTDTRRVRTATPERVIEDDAQRQPRSTARRTSPWDEDGL